VFLRL